jgi:precorrin-3B synthase
MKRGWCPSLYEPMAAGDGLLVRVKPHAATLSATDAGFLAELATRHGNGVIELTSRANLQFRGLTEAGAGAFADAVAGRGLACADRAAERRRNIVVSPLAGVDPGVAEGTAKLAAAMATMLETYAGLDALPAKFGMVVDGGGALPVSGAAGDILLQLRAGQVAISLAGDPPAVRVDAAAAPETTRRLIGAFLDLGVGRMRDHAAGAVFAKAGLHPDTRRSAWNDGVAVGAHGHAFGFGLAFGQLSAVTLHALAGLAARRGDGSLRVGPWRCVLLPGVDARAAGAVGGVITDPNDLALGIAACAGMPACPHATVPTRADALWLARSGATSGRTVHVSGCAKGCARPAAAAFTLVGDAGRYRLIRDGRADAAAPGGRLTLAEAAGQMAS